MPDDTLRQIVHDLAAAGPSIVACNPIRDGWRCDYGECMVTDTVSPSPSTALFRPDYHKPECIWRRSVEAVG